MRQLKFRAWDGTGMLLSPSEVQYLGMWFDALAPGSLYKGGVVFMQFTGLVDKNKREIYEGDIVSFQRRVYEVVINFNGFYLQRYKLWNGKFKPSFQYAMSLITKPSPKGSRGEEGGIVESAEVIGNIYENPELLTPNTSLNKQ
jgi:uncharacterized phage protein (TIGR01671 family)